MSTHDTPPFTDKRIAAHTIVPRAFDDALSLFQSLSRSLARAWTDRADTPTRRVMGANEDRRVYIRRRALESLRFSRRQVLQTPKTTLSACFMARRASAPATVFARRDTPPRRNDLSSLPRAGSEELIRDSDLHVPRDCYLLASARRVYSAAPAHVATFYCY